MLRPGTTGEQWTSVDDPGSAITFAGSWLPTTRHRFFGRGFRIVPIGVDTALGGESDELLGDARVVLGGVHHAELPLSGGLPDLHVASSDIDGLVWDHLLVADLAGDIVVHVEPAARADLAASLVDLAQSGGPRNDAVVAEVLSRRPTAGGRSDGRAPSSRE